MNRSAPAKQAVYFSAGTTNSKKGDAIYGVLFFIMRRKRSRIFIAVGLNWVNFATFV